MTAAEQLIEAASRQRHGNSLLRSGPEVIAAYAASTSPPVAPAVAPNEKSCLCADGIGFVEPYRYGDSNPGFRTENPAS